MGMTQNPEHTETKDASVTVWLWMLRRGCLGERSLFIGFRRGQSSWAAGCMLLLGVALLACQSAQGAITLSRGRSSRGGWAALCLSLWCGICTVWLMGMSGKLAFPRNEGSVVNTLQSLGWNYSCVIVWYDLDDSVTNLSWPARAPFRRF